MKTIPTAIAAAILAAFLILSPALASASTTYTINVGTNSGAYSGNAASVATTGTISGTVSPGPGVGTAVQLQITNPNGVVVFADSATVSAAGSYSDTFPVGGTTNWFSGTYTVTATWGLTATSSTISATTSFSFSCVGASCTGAPSGSAPTLELQAAAPTLLYPGQAVQIFALAFWSNGTTAAGATFTGSHYHNPSGTATVLSAPTSVGPGMFEWTFTLPSTAADGLYAVHLKATDGSAVTWAQTSFTVKTAFALSNNVTSLMNSVAALTTKVNSISSTLSGLSSTVGTVNTNVQGLASTLGTLSTNLGTVNTNVQGLGSQLTTISNNINTISSSISSLSNGITTLTQDVTQMQTTVGNLGGLAQDMTNLQSSVNSLNSSVSNEQTYILVVAALAVITLVLELAILIRKLS